MKYLDIYYLVLTKNIRYIVTQNVRHYVPRLALYILDEKEMDPTYFQQSIYNYPCDMRENHMPCP